MLFHYKTTINNSKYFLNLSLVKIKICWLYVSDIEKVNTIRIY